MENWLTEGARVNTDDSVVLHLSSFLRLVAHVVSGKERIKNKK